MQRAADARAVAAVVALFEYLQLTKLLNALIAYDVNTS